MSLLQKVAFVLAAPLIFVWVLAVLVRYGLPRHDPGPEPEYERDCGWWG